MRRLRSSALALFSALASLGALACEGAATGDPPDAARTPRDAAADPADARAPTGDGGAGGDAGDPPGDDAGPSAVPILVAQGYAGRTTISCDDGRTWIEDRSLDDAIRCFAPGGPDCDHHAGRAKGIVYSHGWFVATWGWGEPGSVQRSRDGVSWETTLAGQTFGGIAASEDVLLLGARSARASDDDGATWSDPIASMLSGWNVRRAGFAPYDEGRFVLVGDAGDVTLSSDAGATWWRPDVLPAACGAGIQNDGGIGFVAGAIVIVGGDGSVCRSTDGGVTWTEHAIGSDVSSAEVVASGDELWVWGGGRAWRTHDGATWEGTPLVPAGTSIGAVARSLEGTFVAVNAGWNRWYEQQRFLRSTDGIVWEELSPGTFAQGHPIHQIRPGRTDVGGRCGAR